jgi:hypothetical protein
LISARDGRAEGLRGKRRIVIARSHRVSPSAIPVAGSSDEAIQMLPHQEPSSSRKSVKRVFALDVAVIHDLLLLPGDKDVDGRDEARP